MLNSYMETPMDYTFFIVSALICSFHLLKEGQDTPFDDIIGTLIGFLKIMWGWGFHTFKDIWLVWQDNLCHFDKLKKQWMYSNIFNVANILNSKEWNFTRELEQLTDESTSPPPKKEKKEIEVWQVFEKQIQLKHSVILLQNGFELQNVSKNDMSS